VSTEVNSASSSASAVAPRSSGERHHAAPVAAAILLGKDGVEVPWRSDGELVPCWYHDIRS